MRRLPVSLSALLILLATVAHADIVPPSPPCTAPSKPHDTDDPESWEIFRAEVAEFRSCIARFIGEQKKAIESHSEAIDRAQRQWKNFVQMELE